MQYYLTKQVYFNCVSPCRLSLSHRHWCRCWCHQPPATSRSRARFYAYFDNKFLVIDRVIRVGLFKDILLYKGIDVGQLGDETVTYLLWLYHSLCDNIDLIFVIRRPTEFIGFWCGFFHNWFFSADCIWKSRSWDDVWIYIFVDKCCELRHFLRQK